MYFNNSCVIVLAAGRGSRLQSNKPKVMNEILFEPMIDYVLNACCRFDSENICVVTAQSYLDLFEYLNKRVVFSIQKNQLGTADAVKSAFEFLNKRLDYDVFICCGDSPCMDEKTIAEALEKHRRFDADVTVITTKLKNPFGYGRIVKENGVFVKIVEESDATDSEKLICEINSGAYWFKVRTLLKELEKIKQSKITNEFYLTELVEVFKHNFYEVQTFLTLNSNFCLGVNTKTQLFEVSNLLSRKKLDQLMASGVEFLSLDGVLISPSVTIGRATTILPGTIIKKQSKIGQNCVIGPNTLIESSCVGDGCIINASQIYFSEIFDNVRIGPFAHIRPNTVVKSNAKIGDFVELKNSVIGNRTSVAHLSYIGDTTVGQRVNIGCGVVTANFDGKKKHRCEIHDGAFVGCNVNLIAPVSVGENALLAAGSTVSKNVEANKLVVERAKPVVRDRRFFDDRKKN